MSVHESSPKTVTQVHDRVQGALDGLEDRFRELERQITALQRLASLGTVCSMVAHEFNNLLTPMVSYCQYALQRGEPDLLRTAADKTLKNAQRLTTLCGKILGMAVDDSMGGPLTTPLRPIIEDALACLGRDLDKDSISQTIEVPDGLTARVHPASLQQVLFNLLLNARQAMLGRPGRITISARPMDDGRVAIEVADTGCGIKPEHIEKIFEPFFSTKRHETRPDRGGIGLGLHVCRKLMTEQEGDIMVRSKPGEGTTFTLTLPSGA